MGYREALDFIVATGSRGMKAGPARVEALLAALGHPERGLRGVLVAGTNGKGSVCAMVDSACRAAGLSTVLLVKPHLRSYRERIVVDGESVDRAAFAALVERVRPVVDAVEPEVGAPTQFEILTALGIVAARDRAPDVVVCEVGLGGRLDSTNVLDLGVSVVTNVALDHRDVLGDTVEEIAVEKAGIIKPDDIVVTGARGTALEVVRARADEVGARRVDAVLEAGMPHWRSLGVAGAEVEVETAAGPLALRLPLAGAFQAANAAVAVATCAALRDRGIAVGPQAVRDGLERVHWPGRLQWLAGEPPMLLDGAHNPAAIEAVVPAIREIAAERPLAILFGAMADKDTAGMIEALRPLGGMPVFTQAGTPRAARAVDLARAWGPGARAISSLPDALSAARTLAGREGVVAVCGSIYLVGDVLALLGQGTE